ncbi:MULTISPECIES: DUF957 domain-containing protein [Enterobacter]|uniref:DUF957 domain-containing protein n=1 Tax=Enterobacter TaxID=547 RepID=UPI00090203BC|nr:MULTISPECIES: DUF957 domain-containing protein [Enterobacter]EKS6337030.1 DUF957 domain-containing protein [Enterobacter hormaechei]VAL43645.1 Enterobacterial protein of uncharacterised function (DUF957) [Enterobacter kobei]
MPELTTEAALNVLIGGLQDNTNCDSAIDFDNDECSTDLAALLPWIEHVRRDVCNLRHLHRLQQARTN